MNSYEACDSLIVRDDKENITYYLSNRELIYSYMSENKLRTSSGNWMVAENSVILYRFSEDKEGQWRVLTPKEEADQVISWLADLELFKAKKTK